MADARYADLVRKLAARGWEVTRRERGVGWWGDEIWTVESVWAPQGFTLFLTWLIDPMDLVTVWAVRASLERPADGGAAGSAACMSINRWPRDVTEFLARLDALRDEHLRSST